MIDRFNPSWRGEQGVPAKHYRCGFCARDVTFERGYAVSNSNHGIWIWPGCNRPTFSGFEERLPGEKGRGFPSNIFRPMLPPLR